MTAAILSSHRRVPPYGLAGGESGAPGRNSVVRTDGSVETLLGADRTEMNAGDIFVIETPAAAAGDRWRGEDFGEFIAYFNKLRKIRLK